MNYQLIKTLCQKKGLTFEALAKDVGMSRTGLHTSFKNGTLKVDILEKISKKLKVPPSSFFGSNEVDNTEFAPVLFKVRQMNGILRGDLILDDATSESYRNAPHDDKAHIKIKLSANASKHFGTDCYVSEVINVKKGLPFYYPRY